MYPFLTVLCPTGGMDMKRAFQDVLYRMVRPVGVSGLGTSYIKAYLFCSRL